MMAFKAQRHVGQDRLWAEEEKATRNGGGPQGAALDWLLKAAITLRKGAHGKEQSRAGVSRGQVCSGNGA